MLAPNLFGTVSGFKVAELTIDGLALCCFNLGKKFWEVAYLRLREPKHDLVIEIQETNVLGEPVGKPQRRPILEDVESIDIRLTNGAEQDYTLFPEGGPADPKFDRNALNNDRHDLNWIIDLAGAEPKHGRIKKLKPKGKGRIPVTLARIHHSLFLVRRPSDEPVRLSPMGNGPTTMGSRLLGRINEEVVGMLFATAPGDIEFVLNSPRGSENFSIPYHGTLLYRIAVTNMDVQTKFLPAEKREMEDGYVKGDFHHFYKVLEVDGEQQELWAVRRTDRAVDGDCHPVKGGGGGSLKTLQPLIEP